MFGIRNKIYIIPLSIVVICLIIISAFFGIYMMAYIKNEKLRDFQCTTQSKVEEADAFLHSIERDVTSISHNTFLTNLIDAVKREDTEEINHCKFEVEMLFKTFSESRRIYDQIRYIDFTGHEVVRVDINGKGVYVVPQEELRDKSNRYYFQETVKLNEGNVYISELDLNREGGSVEIPHKPMLRYAVPVSGSDKQVQGIVVLNVQADHLLKKILTREILNGAGTYLLDQDGYYLLHPEATKQWGGLNDLNTGENVKRDLPQETAALILSGKPESRLVDKQFFNLIPIYFDSSNHERYWIMAESLDKSIVYSPIYAFVILLCIVIALLIAGAVVFSLIFLKRITNPLRLLVKGTKQIADGDLEHTITIEKKHNEITELTETFNLMVKRLRASSEENRQLFLQLKQGQGQWQETFDTITDLITIHDKDLRIIMANRAFSEKFNISTEELHNKKYHEIFHGTDEPSPTCPLVRIVESLHPEFEEVEGSDIGGAFLVSVYPILDEEGKLNGVVRLAKEITERKKVLKEIEMGIEYTENLLETAHDAIVCVDEEGIINIWNQSAEKVFGYKKSEIIGLSVKEIISAGVLDGFLQMSKLIKISEILEISGKTKAGKIIQLEMSLSSQKIEKGRHAFTMIIRDITFQKGAEKQLADKANMLETINRELEEFVYIISHDLKEPLFAIDGYTSRLYRTYKDVYDDKGKLFTDRIKINVQTMSNKIKEIMEVLKIGRIVYKFGDNDSGAIVKDVVNSLETRIKTNRIKVTIDHNLPTVYCDERRLKDLFSNLVTNAIKFMGTSEQAETSHDRSAKERDDELRSVKIGCQADTDAYKFFVEDTGIGIRKEYQEQIFKIFRRLRDIETEGTGVGLAIVKKIVELHSGKLWIESPVEDGRGSRFCFTIPKTSHVSNN